MRNLITELRRRNVFRVAAAYMVVAWVIGQVADVVFPALNLPDWTVTFVVALLILGFPVAVFLAWAYEVTPEGVKRESEVDRSGPEASARNLDWLVIVMLVAAVGLYAGERLWTGEWTLSPAAQDVQTDQPMVAVLPFENLGRPEDEYFADGITDEIIQRLVRIKGIGVIARSSAMQYKDTDKSLTQIADELDADYILEGTVRWEHNDDLTRVRISPQLVRPAGGSPMWAEAYEQPLSEVFRVQAEIAERVTQALNVTLLEPEREALHAEPTDDLDAYDDYLRGREYMQEGASKDNYHLALLMFERAVERDPAFALAHAAIAQVHLGLYWFRHDRTAERLEKASQAIERARSIDSNLPEVRRTMGVYHYWGYRNYEQALRELELAREGMPSDAETHLFIGFVKRRQGRWDAAIENMRKAVRYDPRSVFNHRQFGNTLQMIGNYAESRQQLAEAIRLNPEWTMAYVNLARLHVAAHGDISSARDVLDEASHIPELAESRALLLEQVSLDLYERDYRRVLERLEPVTWKIYARRTVQALPFYRGLAHARLGEAEQARTHFKDALSLLESRLEDNPDDPVLHSKIGIVHAYLSRKDEAIRYGEQGVELLPMERDAVSASGQRRDLAHIYAQVGEHEAAIELLEDLLSQPGRLTVTLLRLDPVWDPLREHPDFQRLLEKKSS